MVPLPRLHVSQTHPTVITALIIPHLHTVPQVLQTISHKKIHERGMCLYHLLAQLYHLNIDCLFPPSLFPSTLPPYLLHLLRRCMLHVQRCSDGPTSGTKVSEKRPVMKRNWRRGRKKRRPVWMIAVTPARSTDHLMYRLFLLELPQTLSLTLSNFRSYLQHPVFFTTFFARAHTGHCTRTI